MEEPSEQVIPIMVKDSDNPARVDAGAGPSPYPGPSHSIVPQTIKTVKLLGLKRPRGRPKKTQD